MNRATGFSYFALTFLFLALTSAVYADMYEMELANGKTATGVSVVRMSKGKIPNTYTSVYVELRDKTMKNVGAKAIKEIRDYSGDVLWKFSPDLNALVAPEDERSALEAKGKSASNGIAQKTETDSMAGPGKRKKVPPIKAEEDDKSFDEEFGMDSESGDESSAESDAKSGDDDSGSTNEAVLVPSGKTEKPKKSNQFDDLDEALGDSDDKSGDDSNVETKTDADASSRQDLSVPYAERLQQNVMKYRQTGVLPWTELDFPEYKRRLEEQRAQVKEFQQAFPQLKTYETRYFILATDAPPAVFRHIVLTLDNMYALLCKSFGITQIEEGSAEDFALQMTKSGNEIKESNPEDEEVEESDVKPAKKEKKKPRAKKIWKNIWQAKCTIVVFMNEMDYNRFEMRFFKAVVPSNVRGLCHQNMKGEVLISCKSTENPLDFYSVLVHETTHGFVWMHRSAKSLPTWFNEGIAEWCAAMTVPQSKSIPIKQRAGLDRIRQTGSLGGLFSLPDIAAWQYGIASMMVDMILKSNSKIFIELINGIKDGEDPQECFKKHYKVDYEQFARVFGRKHQIPFLRL